MPDGGPVTAHEVPILGGDKLRWIELTVPSSSPPSPEPIAPIPSRDVAGCQVIAGDPTAYLTWRIHKNLPNVLEVVELFASKEFPETGLHLAFQDAICPFAFICTNQIHSTARKQYMLYVLTVSGVAYCLYLRSPFTYISGSNFPRDEILEFDLEKHMIAKIAVVAATSGCLVTGRQDGSIGCFRLGGLEFDAPDFYTELRDDAGLGRLWNIMSRAKNVASVQDMVVSQVCGRNSLFALHLDGCLRIWDLSSRTRILNHNISLGKPAGITPSKLWVGASNISTNSILLAVLYRGDSVADTIAVCNFDCSVGDKISFSSEPSMRIIHLEQGRLVDLKISSSKLWLLKEDGSMMFSLSQTDCKLEHSFTYAMQEDFLADLLFQSTEYTSDELIWTNNSIFSLLKGQITNFVSSIFLRRLLQPGVHQAAALRAIVADQTKYLFDHEFQSLTLAVLKKEISSIIESEGVAASSSSTICYWKNFCSHFFRYWCQNNNPYGLFIDSSNDVVGLIRKKSVSVFRSLEGLELLLCNTDFSGEFNDLKSFGLIIPDNEVDCDILCEVLRCTCSISQQLGRTASALFYESLVNPIISSEDVLFHLLKMLETGYSPSASTSFISHVGEDTTSERRQVAPPRKFSVYMFLSLHALRVRATSWTKVLDVITKYLDYLKPEKCILKYDTKGMCNINSSLLVLATSQIARVMFDASFEILLLLGYLINVSGQVDMMQTDVARIKLELIPMIQETLTHWLILHFLGTTPTTSPAIDDDFSSRLSSLHIGNTSGKGSFDAKLGSSDFTLACLLDFPSADDSQSFLSSTSFPKPTEFFHAVQMLCSSIIRGSAYEESSFSSSPLIEIASLLLSYGQYEAAENLFLIMDAYSSKRKVNLSVQSIDGEWCARSHLLGFCLLLRAQNGLHGALKEQKIHDAIRCFFRAASGQGASRSLQNLSYQTGFVYSGPSGSEAVWKFHYYQWAMQVFEQYGFSKGACQFSLAALEQVDEIIGMKNGNDDVDDLFPEPASTVRGRLWANVFKFSLDQKHYRDGYCAIISNPDEDSKYICLRRFIIVLCELGAAKILCDGKLPFVGLVEKVEQELVWKAERSDISARPNLYKLLYAFEAHRNNWRKAATYMYRYSVRLRKEITSVEIRQLPFVMQEIILGLSTAINSLELVDHAHAWIDPQHECGYAKDQGSPNKKARNALSDSSDVTVDSKSWNVNFHVDIETLEKEYVLTSAQYLLTLMNDKFKYSENQTLAYLVDSLIQENLYDMAFTVMFKFWKGSGLKRELEQTFVAITQKCCSDRISSSAGHRPRTCNLLLPSPDDQKKANGETKNSSEMHHFRGNGQWETLELYLEKYRRLHPRLPVIVAETLLHTDPQIELPLWLVQMFKGGRRAATSWGMAGLESDPATLFRLYVDCGRHAEATNLLLEYLESFASLRASDVINRKKMSAIWFPYTAIERLWCQLEELKSAGQMIEQCDKLQRQIHGALSNHLKLVKVDSEDALSCGLRRQTDNTSS